MIARQPIDFPIVFTGPAGSGKSKLAAATAKRANCEQVNVGTVLQQKLAERGFSVHHRRDIGPLFLQHFTKEDYIDVIFSLLDRAVVVDGVRLAAALKVARKKGIKFFHVMREGRPDWTKAPTEPFSYDVGAMRETADEVVGWLPDAADLDGPACAIVAEVRKRAYKGPVWTSWDTGELQSIGR